MSNATTTPYQSFLSRHFAVLLIAACLVFIVCLVHLFGSVMVQRVVIEALIRIVIVVGIYIFTGNSGIISFGSVTFMAIAAYATGWQTCCEMLKPITMSGLPSILRDNSYPVYVSALTSVSLAALAAFVVGLILMRLGGLAASISTLAILFILNVSYSNWETVTMGTASMVGLPTYITPWIALGAALIAVVCAWVFQNSARGILLRATRADEVAAAACGVSLYWSRLIAWTLSGAVMGLAGVLTAHFLGTVSINSYFLNLTFLALAMLVVGGMKSLSGAVVGVVVVSTIVDMFRRLEAGVSLGDTTLSLPAGTQELVLAGVMIVILMFRKDGLMGGKEFCLPKRWAAVRSESVTSERNAQ
ncbi:branched-chain amino acid ABC transporter permease [Roseovarius sp. ZX-A-9]|uniref:branched-chain amino acid ABC transporter permease n=1 Tax=Roseovarius sp. ZX-A-9 TaxID=3014783 RepID=UPI00232FD130|nr:branched-chain amino acid ABC transporter permease [Roseovarius sp. ZX-A-9]